MSDPSPSPSFREVPPPIFAEAAEVVLEQLRRDRERTTGVVRKMLDHLEGALFDPTLSVQTWKHACAIRDNSVAIRFHKALGIPPRSYVERLRLEVASRLLRDSSLRIWQIADLLGFSSLAILSKAFTRCLGIRPSEYRRQAQEGESPAFLITERELEKVLAGDSETEQVKHLIAAIRERYPGLELESLAAHQDDADDRRSA